MTGEDEAREGWELPCVDHGPLNEGAVGKIMVGENREFGFFLWTKMFRMKA